jgi:hypothetical protein
MSTDAQSAQQWLIEQTPSHAKIQQVINQLERRLETIDHEHPAWEGSLAALELLQSELIPLQTTQSSKDEQALLDYSGLVNYEQVDRITLSEQEKLRRFIALKQQLSSDKK